MSIKRFQAATAREAMAKARLAFGDSTVILSNRSNAQGVEVLATSEELLNQMDGGVDTNSNPSRSTRPLDDGLPATRLSAPPQEDARELAMSTLSFQDYVRERMLRKQSEEQAQPMPAKNTLADRLNFGSGASASPPARPTLGGFDEPRPQAVRPRPASTTPANRQTSPAPLHHGASAAVPQGIMSELQAMKHMIEERFNTLTWLGQAKQSPIHSNMMVKLIRAGFSPTVARAVLERLPEDLDAARSVRWVMDVLERNIKTDAQGAGMTEEGGVYALVGATGVGKTTTTAKLAAMCVRTHGAGSVGLITLDTYRIAAHEQLRAYGRMLGVVAHLAHDRAALQDLLNLLANKRMVLIDTTGLAPRDPRTREMLDVLDLPNLQRVVVLNAGSHGDTLDETINSFKTHGLHGGILSKMDEAVKLGPALDSCIRHQLTLRGVATGQRVPEDWERADAAKLIKMSMRTPGKSAYDPSTADLGFLFSEPSNLGAAYHA